MRDFATLAFAQVGLDAADHIEVNPQFLRPAEVEILHGDPRKAEATLGWKAKTPLADLVGEMVEADLLRVKRGQHL